MSETLSLNSLVQLAHGLAKDVDGLTFAMLLNLPTITIINIIYDVSDEGLINDEEGEKEVTVVEKCMMLWREQTADQKNKDRIRTLEKALREMGKNETADKILECYQNHQEITSDIFA